jgi:ABC-type Fe3+/spermidine/putrescine transport system ATPase subunit
MKQTALYVTHDQEEAFTLADRVVVMDQGRVAQIDTPMAIYRQPASEFVARFLGFSNIFEAIYDHGCLKTEIGEFKLETIESLRGSDIQPDLLKTGFPILIRPDAIQLNGEGSHQITGTLIEIKFRGILYRVAVQINRKTVVLEYPSFVALPQPGDTVVLSFYPEEAFQILS